MEYWICIDNGDFALVVSNENKPASFKFHVIDALGFKVMRQQLQ